MKFICGKSELVDAIHRVGRVITGRTTLPILNNILLTPKETVSAGAGPGIQLAAYDLKLAIRTSFIAASAEPPGIAVPARLFSDIVSALPGEEVSFESDPQSSRAKVSSGRSVFNLHGMPSQEFPSLPELPDEPTFTLPQGQLKEMIRQTQFSSAKEETRPPMTGTLFLLENDFLTLVTTDTYRLAARTCSLPPEGSRTGEGKPDKPIRQKEVGQVRIIVPTRALLEMERLLSSGEEEVKIAMGTNLAQFTFDNTVLVSNLIEGHFPDHTQVIPTEWENRITLKTKEFESALRRVELVARENANRVILRAQDGSLQGETPQGGTLRLSAITQGVGEAEEEIDVNLEGEGLTIGFNVRYLIEVLSVIEAEEVRLSLRGSTNPGLVEPVSDMDYKYVLMPIHLREEER